MLTMSENRKAETHPMYGMLGFSRVNSPGGKTLFGSHVECNNYVEVTLKSAKLERSLNQEWFFGDKIIAQVALSPAQFAEAITCMNNGDGVPCTIIFGPDGHHRLMDNPYKPDYECREQEFKETCSDINQNVQAAISKATGILAQKTVKKSDLKEVISLLNKATQEMTSTIPYMQKSFHETVQNDISEAKQEIEAFIQHRMMSIGALAVEEKQRTLANSEMQHNDGQAMLPSLPDNNSEK